MYSYGRTDGRTDMHTCTHVHPYVDICRRTCVCVCVHLCVCLCARGSSTSTAAVDTSTGATALPPRPITLPPRPIAALSVSLGSQPGPSKQQPTAAPAGKGGEQGAQDSLRGNGVMAGGDASIESALGQEEVDGGWGGGNEGGGGKRDEGGVVSQKATLKRSQSLLRAASMRKVNDHLRI